MAILLSCSIPRILRLAVICNALCYSFPSSSQSPDLSAFDVASVRSVPSMHGYTEISSPGSAVFAARNASLKLLLEIAYGVDDNQIKSKIGWLDNEYYDVQAKMDSGAVPTKEELQFRLQKLLSDRFRLHLHRTSVEVDGYALIPLESGARLRPALEQGSQPFILPEGIQASAITMRTLAGMLSHSAGKPVADHTMLLGLYQVNLSFAVPSATDTSTLPSLFTAVQEQLGLKLEPHKVSLDIISIDSAEKEPASN